MSVRWLGIATAALLLVGCKKSEQDVKQVQNDQPAECTDDAYQGNSTPADANKISMPDDGSPWVADDLVLCRGDQDWFEVSAKAGQRMDVTLDFTQSAGDLELELLDTTGRQLALSSSVTDGEFLSYAVTADGSYRVRVYGQGALSTNTYAATIEITGESCAADSLEPNDGAYEASTVLDSQTYPDLTICYGDRDWFAVSAANGEVITATIEFKHKDNDMGLQLYRLNDDGSTTYRAGSDTLSDNETIIYQPFESGTFLLHAYPSRGTTQVSSYGFTVATSGNGCVEDAYEPNNGYTEAATLPDGSYSDMTLCVGDDDWYKVDLNNGETATIDIGFDHATNDLGMQLWQLDPQGTITYRSGSDTLTDNEHITYQPYETGTYLVRVYRSRGTSTATYTLDLAKSGDPCVDDGYEPNNGYTEAATLPDGSYPDMTLCVGDDDWYKVDVNNGQVLNASATFDHASNDLGLVVYELNDDGTITYRRGSDTLTDNETVNYQPFQDGTYLIRVYRSRGTTMANYGLDVSIAGTSCSPDPMEPNNAQAEAVDITPGAYTGMTLCVGDTDWFRLPLRNGELFDASIAFTHADNDLGMALYRDNGDGTYTYMRGSDTLTDNEAFTYQPYQDGDYLLYVYRSRGTTVADYDLDLSVSGSACSEDAYEPNNAYTEATPIAVGNYPSNTLCVGDTDWYSVDVQNGQLLDVKITFDHATNDLGLRIYQLKADGTVTYRSGSDTLTDNEQVLYQPFEDGTYLIYVYRSRGTTVASYQMDVGVSGTACAQDGFEPNNASFEATGLAAGTYNGLSLCVSDTDWYSIDVGNGQILDLSLGFTHADNDLGIRVYKLNADGTTSYRTGSDTLTDNESVLYQPYDSGTFLINVYVSRGTRVAPDYSLDVALRGTTCVSDGYEPNNALAEAWPVTPGAFLSQTLCVGDSDWFTTDVANGQLIDVDLSFVHADNDLGLLVGKLNADGTVSWRAGSNTLTDNERVIYQPYDSGTFVIYIYRTRGTTVADYDMNIAVNGNPCVSDAYETNDTSFDAASIDADLDPATGYGTFPSMTLCVGDADWYSVDVLAGQLADIGINFTHADNDLGLAFYKLNADGTISYRSGSNTLTDNERLLYTPYEDGTYLIYVYRTRGTTLASYSMDVTVSGSGCVADAQEPNNAYTEAVPITPGPYTGQTLCVGDDDWYSIQAGNGQLIQFTASFVHAQNDLGIRLYRLNSDGTIGYLAGSDSLSDNEFILYRPYDIGDNNTYLLRVYRSRGTVTANYDMDITVNGQACISDPLEPNDHWLQAALIGSNTVVSGLSSCIGDVDYFSLGQLASGQTINAQLYFTHADNDLGLYLYVVKPDGTLVGLGGSDSQSDNEFVVTSMPSLYDNMEVVVKVYKSRGTTTALSYDLNVIY